MITGAEEIGGDGGGIGLTRLFGCRRASHLQQEIQTLSDSEEEESKRAKFRKDKEKEKGVTLTQHVFFLVSGSRSERLRLRVMTWMR